MRTTSQKYEFDSRLLAIEAFCLQRKFVAAGKEFEALVESDFSSVPHHHGLYLSLSAELKFVDGLYREAIDTGLRSSKLLACLPLNRRYGKTLLILSKSYSSLGDLKNAERKAYDALASYRRVSDTTGQSNCLNELTRVALLKSQYKQASKFIDEAMELVSDDARKTAQYKGNAGVIRTFSGQWDAAESDLTDALEYHKANNTDLSTVRNLLGLGYLHICKREFIFAEKNLSQALDLIDEHGFKREKVIYLEYAGELALERGDSFKSKSLLTSAYHDGRMLAPESALVSQSGRRLAEVEYLLDNHDDSMKYAQKALEVAQQLGEKSEIVLSHRIIAQLFMARSDKSSALEHIQSSVELAREVGDPLCLAKCLLTQAELKMDSGTDEPDRIRALLDEAGRIFKKLKIVYSLAETEFRAGVFACQQGNLSRGFKKLSRSEKLFLSIGDSGKVRGVNQFLTSLSEQAVAVSMSTDNTYKLFGNLIGQNDIEELEKGQLSDVLDVLARRTGADRAILFSPHFDSAPITATFELSPSGSRRFAEGFQELLGQEISTKRPTLLLDCRRDPYINDLLTDTPDVVASVIVVPLTSIDKTTSYVFLDKLSVDNMLNPFTQMELNFAVGFSEIISFRAAELQRLQLQEDNRRLKEQLHEEAAFPHIISQNHLMLDLLAQVRQVVDSNISVSIEGETGVGKDLLAKAIHYNSKRRDHRFISVNCAALPETLLESELFGFCKGAFTGADRDKSGLFEEADGGTFFLDEIADMPLSVQAKILRVLESKEVVRLGETVPRQVDVRIVSATNKDLKVMMSAKEFRSDLYYRLSAFTFRLPALRERKEDIPLLVEHFLEDSGKTVSLAVMKQLVAYDWPGNIRELDNEVKKLILLSGDSPSIEPDVLSGKLSSFAGDDISIVPSALASLEDISFDERYSLYDFLAEHERKFIVRALQERNGVKKHAAASLKIPESTLRLKIKQYNIDLNRLDSIH